MSTTIKTLSLWLVVVVVAIVVYNVFNATPTEDRGITFSQHLKDVEKGNVRSVMITRPANIVEGEFDDGRLFKTVAPEYETYYDTLLEKDVVITIAQSDESPYFRDGRLTWLVEEKAFEFSGTNSQGKRHVLRGNFSQPPRQVAGDADDQPQMTFKLELTETGAPPPPTSWRLVFNQQENNRMLVELSRRRGRGTFRLQDTIGCQREGTSFALSDSDYGEKTCVISQGLGTTPVSYKGKTYWVCCSGCKAAFEEEPEKWIARFEAIKAEQSSR